MFLIFVLSLLNVLVIDVDGREKMPRYVVEEGVKPPIFGSYSYNPLTQTFDIKEDTSSKADVLQIQIFNKTVTQTLGTTHNLSARIFRKHVISEVPKSYKTFNWWTLLAKNKTKFDNVLRTFATKAHNVRKSD